MSANAKVTSTEWKPPYVKRSERWCGVCAEVRHLKLNTDAPTCDVCETVHPAIHVSAASQTCVTPFLTPYGRML